jgi:hypothetical protein
MNFRNNRDKNRVFVDLGLRSSLALTRCAETEYSGVAKKGQVPRERNRDAPVMADDPSTNALLCAFWTAMVRAEMPLFAPSVTFCDG